MKKYGMSIVSAILGSLFTFGIIAGYVQYKSKHSANYFWSSVDVPVRNASYTSQIGSSGTFPDFTDAAAKTMNEVVHIKAKKIIKQQVPQGNFYFPGMPNDLFQQFFGNPYGGQQQLPDQEQVGTGSGVIIKADGYIVTNNHVIDNADEIEVTLHDNRTFKASVIVIDASTDLALLKIEATDLSFMPLANSDEVKVGQWVLAVGNPFNLNSTVTAGIVSAKGRNININKDKYAIESFIQTDAAINPGNSGGALCNLDGELVGINTAIASPTGAYSGYGFAIPANIVRKVIGGNFGVVGKITIYCF
jgi:S1-C subfamily serine protease